MPRIDPKLIGTSIYLYDTFENAHKGSRTGGSGVLVGHPPESNPTAPWVHLYAVTNVHVVCAGYGIPRAMTRAGQPRVFDLDIDQSPWEDLPSTRDDVAVRWVGCSPIGDDREVEWVPVDWLATEDDLRSAVRTDWPFPWSTGPVAIGEETFSVARFIGFDGNEQNKPTVRFGNLCSEGTVLVPHTRDRDQESLLVEERSFSGSSGAPVFAYREGTYTNGGVPPIDSALLLGLGWGHLNHPDDDPNEYALEKQKRGRPGVGRRNSGVMVVVPAWKLQALLASKDVVDRRRGFEENGCIPDD